MKDIGDNKKNIEDPLDTETQLCLQIIKMLTMFFKHSAVYFKTSSILMKVSRNVIFSFTECPY